MARVDVRKTYKLYIGGAFPRSESGHSYVVEDSKGKFVANAAKASRKDARDAVVAARGAFKGWSGRTAYNRAQILYRIAEVMEDRRPQFVEAVRQSEGLTPARANAAVDDAIDRLVWYAGWADKLTQVVGNANPVAGPFFNLSTPEPSGVVAVVAPEESSLLGLISVVAPVIVSGNTAVVMSSYTRPLPAVTFSEVLATSDVPGGVVNILTGDPSATAPWLAAHMDVNGLDLTGLAGHDDVATLAVSLEEAAAENLKRVRRAPAAVPDWSRDPGLEPMTPILETKTVWHPIGVLTVSARVLVLAGPSGAGKSRLAERLGLPVLRLDDFYRSANDDGLPLITEGANAGLVDWDHPDSWFLDDALDAIRTLCRDGRAHVPVYDIARSGRFGEQLLDLDGHQIFAAEGIFAQEVVPACEREGLLEAAYCVTQHPMVTFWRRLTRDLREHRKPPLVLVRRGWSLMRAQRQVVQHAEALGCRQVSPDEAYAEIRERQPARRG